MTMNICIIHGSPRKGNTHQATEIVKEQLRSDCEVMFREFFLPKDLPNFCVGCYRCFNEGEHKCPHAGFVQPIAEAMREADGLILTSPVYVLAESGVMKALLDHFGYLYIPHRPMEEMFSKVALIISTTAGAGTKYAIAAMARSLRYWGVSRIYKCGLTMYAARWDEMPPKRQARFRAKLGKQASAFKRAVANRRKLRVALFPRVVFYIIRRMLLKYDDGQPDKEYWREKGWLTGKKKPF